MTKNYTRREILYNALKVGTGVIAASGLVGCAGRRATQLERRVETAEGAIKRQDSEISGLKDDVKRINERPLVEHDYMLTKYGQYRSEFYELLGKLLGRYTNEDSREKARANANAIHLIPIITGSYNAILMYDNGDRKPTIGVDRAFDDVVGLPDRQAKAQGKVDDPRDNQAFRLKREEISPKVLELMVK